MGIVEGRRHADRLESEKKLTSSSRDVYILFLNSKVNQTSIPVAGFQNSSGLVWEIP